MWRTDSLEKTLMLGKIEGRRRRGRQRMRWLDGISDSVDTSLRNSGRWWRTGKCGVAVHEVAKSWTRLSDWTMTTLFRAAVFAIRLSPHPPIQKRETWWSLVKLFIQLPQWRPFCGSEAAPSSSRFHPGQRAGGEPTVGQEGPGAQSSQKHCSCSAFWPATDAASPSSATDTATLPVLSLPPRFREKEGQPVHWGEVPLCGLWRKHPSDSKCSWHTVPFFKNWSIVDL